jgi:hypothetical protein
VLLLGISPEGVEAPRTGGPLRLVAVLLSPAEQPDAHLALLADLARALSDPGAVDRVIARVAAAAGGEAPP